MKCIICASPLIVYLRKFGGGEYDLAVCESCGLNICHPMPDESSLANFYQGFLFNHCQYGKNTDESTRQRLVVREMIDAAVKRWNLPENGEFLDYGGGLGLTASEFANAGYKATLFDLDEAACDYARANYGCSVTVCCGRSGYRDLIENGYDLVYASQVVEHVRDPVELMNTLFRFTKPGGIVIVTTPNQMSGEFFFRPNWLSYYLKKGMRSNDSGIFRKFARHHWLNFDPPRHLVIFNSRNLTCLGSMAGFVPLDSFSEFGHESIYNHRRKLGKRTDFPSKVSRLFNFYERFTLLIARPFRYFGLEGNNLVFVGRKELKAKTSHAHPVP